MRRSLFAVIFFVSPAMLAAAPAELRPAVERSVPAIGPIGSMPAALAPVLDAPRVLTAFEENRSNWDVYKYHDCAANVKRLFDKIKSSVPSVTTSDFNPVIIAHPRGSNPFAGVGAVNTRMGKDIFSFHAVLEFQGLVLDLDNASARAQDVSEYVRTFFPHPASKDWAAHVIPGENFFPLNEDALGQRATIKKLIEAHGAASPSLLKWASAPAASRSYPTRP